MPGLAIPPADARTAPGASRRDVTVGTASCIPVLEAARAAGAIDAKLPSDRETPREGMGREC